MKPIVCIDGKPVMYDYLDRRAAMVETTQPQNQAKTWVVVPEEFTTAVVTREGHAYEFKGQFPRTQRESGRGVIWLTTDRAVIHGRS